MAATDLAPTIGTAGQGPASATTDGVTVAARPLADLATGDRYLAAKAGRSNRRRGLILTKLIPAAAFPDSQGTGLGGSGNFSSPGGLA